MRKSSPVTIAGRGLVLVLIAVLTAAWMPARGAADSLLMVSRQPALSGAEGNHASSDKLGTSGADGRPLGRAASAPVIGALAAYTEAAQAPSVVVVFDPATGELPEGVAVDAAGNVYVGMAPTGEIKRVAPDGAVSTFARLPDPSPGFLLGLTHQFGCLFALLASSNPDSHGIWCITPDGGLGAPPFALMDPAGMPNAIAIGPSPFPFVSDSRLGRIWTVRPELDAAGRMALTAVVWKDDPLLQGNPASPLGFPIGANGVAVSDGYLYVANTDYGRIVRIPILPDPLPPTGPGPAGFPPGPPISPLARAGQVEVVVEDPVMLVGADGIAFDRLGNLYVAVMTQSRLVRISASREITVLAEGEAVPFPASLAFGAGADAATLYITSFPILQTLGIAPGVPRPALLKIDVGVPGLPPAGPPVMGPPAPGAREQVTAQERALRALLAGEETPENLAALRASRNMLEAMRLSGAISEAEYQRLLARYEDLARQSFPPGAPNSIRLEAVIPAQGSVLASGAEVTFTAEVSYTLAADSGRIVLIVQDQANQPLQTFPQPSVEIVAGTGSATLSGTIWVPDQAGSIVVLNVALVPAGSTSTDTVVVVTYPVR